MDVRDKDDLFMDLQSSPDRSPVARQRRKVKTRPGTRAGVHSRTRQDELLAGALAGPVGLRSSGGSGGSAGRGAREGPRAEPLGRVLRSAAEPDKQRTRGHDRSDTATAEMKRKSGLSKPNPAAEQRRAVSPPTILKKKTPFFFFPPHDVGPRGSRKNKVDPPRPQGAIPDQILKDLAADENAASSSKESKEKENATNIPAHLKLGHAYWHLTFHRAEKVSDADLERSMAARPANIRGECEQAKTRTSGNGTREQRSARLGRGGPPVNELSVNRDGCVNDRCPRRQCDIASSLPTGSTSIPCLHLPRKIGVNTRPPTTNRS